MNKLAQQLSGMNVCKAAVDHYKQADLATQEAWNQCEHCDYMFIWAAKHCPTPGGANHKKLVAVAAECVGKVGEHGATNETILHALEQIKQWSVGQGGVSIDDVRSTGFELVDKAVYIPHVTEAMTKLVVCATSADADAMAQAVQQLIGHLVRVLIEAKADTRQVLDECLALIRGRIPVVPHTGSDF